MAAGDKRLLTDASFAIERGEHVGARRAERLRQDDAARDGARPPRARSRARCGSATASCRRTSRSTRSSSTSAAACSTAPSAATGLSRPQAQNLLGRFLFSGWEAHEKPVTALSGGERRRLALALVVASGANFLVLDEPTNHLDLESREALEEALDAFPGTVLLVSHDRALLDAVAHRLLAIEHGALRSYDGGWAEYAQHRAEPAEARADAAVRKEKPQTAARAAPRPERARAARGPDLRARRRPSPSSSGGSPTTGRTSTRSPPTARRARSYRPDLAVGAAVRGGASLGSRGPLARGAAVPVPDADGDRDRGDHVLLTASPRRRSIHPLSTLVPESINRYTPRTTTLDHGDVAARAMPCCWWPCFCLRSVVLLCARNRHALSLSA